VVHRDIKPENILLQDGHALLADFGVARALHEATSGGRLTDVGTGIGTPGYMAPEQMRTPGSKTPGPTPTLSCSPLSRKRARHSLGWPATSGRTAWPSCPRGASIGLNESSGPRLRRTDSVRHPDGSMGRCCSP
jgi:serine/threonine protein kinase